MIGKIGVQYKKVTQAVINRRVNTQVRPYQYIAYQKLGWVGADLCICPSDLFRPVQKMNCDIFEFNSIL